VQELQKKRQKNVTAPRTKGAESKKSTKETKSSEKRWVVQKYYLKKSLNLYDFAVNYFFFNSFVLDKINDKVQAMFCFCFTSYRICTMVFYGIQSL